MKLLEIVPVDIIYCIVNYLNGYNISMLNSTNKEIKILIGRNQKIWSNLLNLTPHLWQKQHNLPKQFTTDFNKKTRQVYAKSNFESSFLKYSLHYFAIKYVIIQLRNELREHFQKLNVLFLYGPTLFNIIMLNFGTDDINIIDTQLAYKAFTQLVKNLHSSLTISKFHILNKASDIEYYLYVCATNFGFIMKYNLIINYICDKVFNDNDKSILNVLKRLSRRMIYLSKVMSLSSYRINLK